MFNGDKNSQPVGFDEFLKRALRVGEFFKTNLDMVERFYELHDSNDEPVFYKVFYKDIDLFNLRSVYQFHLLNKGINDYECTWFKMETEMRDITKALGLNKVYHLNKSRAVFELNEEQIKEISLVDNWIFKFFGY